MWHLQFSSLQEEIEIEVPVPADDLTLPTDLNNSNQREQEELLQPESEEVESSSHEEDTVNPNGGPGHQHGGVAPKTNKYPACGIPSLPTKPSSQQKLPKKKKKDLPTYNLA